MSTNTTPAVILSADDATAAALVRTIHGAVAGRGKYAAYVAAHDVTRENVKDHAFALAVLAYPNDETVQTVKDADGNKVRTRFGNAVQAAGYGLRQALPAAAPKPTDYLANITKAVEAALAHGIDPTVIRGEVLALVPAASADLVRVA